MKKIIKNKVYDTDTAIRLATYSSPGGPRDFSHYEESLYRKKTGEYFLHGIGGPMTRYAVPVDTNSWSGGERIMPLTYNEASEWAQEHLDGDDYEAIFGAVIEDEGKKAVTYRLTAANAEKLRRIAERESMSASDYLDRVLASI